MTRYLEKNAIAADILITVCGNIAAVESYSSEENKFYLK